MTSLAADANHSIVGLTTDGGMLPGGRPTLRSRATVQGGPIYVAPVLLTKVLFPELMLKIRSAAWYVASGKDR